MEPGSVIGIDTLQRLSKFVILAECEVEFRLDETHLDAIVQQAAVELAEVSHLGIDFHRQDKSYKSYKSYKPSFHCIILLSLRAATG